MNFLKSKKVKALFVGIVGVVGSALLDLPPHIADVIAGLVAIYIGSQGYADGKSKGNTSSCRD